jgi:predicted  nucleic acid-binding Zn-ribbon protein
LKVIVVSQEIERLRRRISSLQELHQKESVALQNKLKWYIENQKVIDVYESEAAQKDSRIQSLEQQLRVSTGSGLIPHLRIVGLSPSHL